MRLFLCKKLLSADGCQGVEVLLDQTGNGLSHTVVSAGLGDSVGLHGAVTNAENTLYYDDDAKSVSADGSVKYEFYGTD